MFPPSSLNSLYRVVPVGNVNKVGVHWRGEAQLQLFFPLPSQYHDTVKNSAALLSSLIGHEGEGSILVALRVVPRPPPHA